MRNRTLIALTFILCAALSFADTLSKTSVGRFGAGKKITENTATQDLVAWNVRNTGKAIDLRFYSPKGDLASLGYCGFDSGLASVENKIHNIGWTQLWSTYISGAQKIDVLESILTPVLWFRTSGTSISLFQPDEAAAIMPRIVDFYKSSEPWAVAIIESKGHTVPVAILYHRSPSSVVRNDKGIRLEWKGPNQFVGLVPVYGCNPKPSLDMAKAKTRARAIAKRFLSIPIALNESYQVINKHEIKFANTVKWLNAKDDWGWSRPFCPVPAAVSAAKLSGYPAKFSKPLANTGVNGYLSPFEVVDGSSLEYSLPIPDLYSTLAPPFADKSLAEMLPAPTQKTISEYSDYILKSYTKRERNEIFNKSALGEARMLSSEYPNYRMMSKEAQAAFGSWADWAAKDRLYNRNENYGYGKDVANGRKFLLDNYRFGAHDYMDAGWFGYSLVAMWSRAHFANKWSEVKDNWQLIKDLFYGWNWTYIDYHACNAPLYIDAEKGGNPKGYTDSMSMFGASYAWARMADKIGDKPMLNDSLYILAKERVGRFARMMMHEWASKCGYETDVYYLTSDMGNGPNIALTSNFIPTKTVNTQQDVVDYGPANGGLWYISGSYLEPVTSETIDLMNEGSAKAKVKTTVDLMDSRYRRWWASPAAGEVANYQMMLRGGLFHTDPGWLRYVFDYQNPYGRGVWMAESWHANAFAGIVMSSMRGLENQKNWSVVSSTKDLVEKNLWSFAGNTKGFTLYSHASKPIRAQVVFSEKLKDYRRPNYVNAKNDKPVKLEKLTLMPGLNIFVDSAIPEVLAPISVQGYAGQTMLVRTMLHNSSSKKRVFSVGSSIVPGSVKVPMEPGEIRDIDIVAKAAPNASASSSVDIIINDRKYPVAIHTLPAYVAQIELSAVKVATLPNLGKATVTIANQIDSPKQLKVIWGVDGVAKETKSVDLKGKSSERLELVLESKDVAPGKHILFVEVEGISKQTARQVITTDSKDPILLFDFTHDTEDWTMPDWPEANKSPNGVRYACTAPDQTLNIPLSFNKLTKTEGFVNYGPASNWQRFRSVSADIYVPADAPKGILGSFFLMGDGWKWNIPLDMTPLVPGKWNRIEAPLNDENLETYWKVPYSQFFGGLRHVIGFGIRITKPDGVAKYQGVFKLDNVAVVPR